MSETVHYKGNAKLIASGDGMEEVAKDIVLSMRGELPSYHDSYLECLRYDYEELYFYYYKTKCLYKIESRSVDIDEEIIHANFNDDDTISFELKFYNGGASAAECLEEAFDKLYKK